MTQLKVGCCGFPRARRKYSEQFKLVEIQQTFYKPPAIGAAQKWRDEVPEDFEFTLKAWQEITHLPSSPTYRKAGLRIPAGDREWNYGFFKPSQEVFDAWQQTRGIARILRAKVIVFQCPPSFSPIPENVENMRYFFKHVDRGDFIFVWEPRGEWSQDTVLTLSRELDLVHCVDPLESKPACGKLRYFRLHGGRDYRHRYTDDELATLRDLTAGEAYVLFNNITMYDDALRFKHLVESSS